jgi:alpha-tubulin suppressor-like RCC1 family protein
MTNGWEQNAAPPWSALLITNKLLGLREEPACSGAVVGDGWVLTAAHCVVDGKGRTVARKGLRVLIGRADRDATNQGAAYGVASIRVAPGYGTATGPDVALVQLQLFDSERWSALPLAFEQTAVDQAGGVTVYGYGNTGFVPKKKGGFESQKGNYLQQGAGLLWKSPDGAFVRDASCDMSPYICLRPNAQTQTMGGDSGSAWLRWVSGAWQIIAVHHGVLNPVSPYVPTVPSLATSTLRATADGSAVLEWVRDVAALPVPPVGSIVRDPASGAAWLMGGDRYRRSIPTGGDYNCLVDQGARVINLSSITLDTIPERVGTQARCSQSSVTAISSGWDHTCALLNPGTVKCWGRNDGGTLGDGTYTSRLTPVDVVGLTSSVASVSVGLIHSCTVTTTEAAVCWGVWHLGSFRFPTWMPMVVDGLSTGVASISSGVINTCVVTTAGAAKCWGSNDFGELGDGTTTERQSPVDVVGLSSAVVAISVGSTHACAVTTGGGVKCWGSNTYGQLGDGTFTDRLTPVGVTGLASGVVAISAGNSHTCALTSAGAVKCWGNGFNGQLGNGSTGILSAVPVDVTGLSSGVATISSKDVHTCVVTNTGAAKCWGTNAQGQLGDGTTTDRSTPVGVVGLSSGVSVIDAGGAHTCAVMSSGTVKCWGRNTYGELGDGTTISRLTPTDVAGL